MAKTFFACFLAYMQIFLYLCRQIVKIANSNRMKAIKTIILLVGCVCLFSCSKPSEGTASLDETIAQYEQACAAGDVQSAMTIAEDLKAAELSPEQSVRVIKASNNGAKIVSDQFKSVANAMPYNSWDLTLNKYEALIKEYAGVLKQKEAGKKVKDKLEQLDDKIDDLKDKLNDAQLTKAQKARFKKLKDWYDDIED